MVYFAAQILLGIALLNCVDSQDRTPTFMNKVENCPDSFSGNIIDDNESRENLDIDYLLFTRKNPQKEYIMKPNPKSVANSTFNPCVGTIFLIHGYFVNLPKASVMFEIKDELLKQGEFNVVVVDWTKYNVGFYSVEVIKTVPKVSSDIAEMIKVLMSVTGIKSESVYLVGHSMGAHVAGCAGRNTPDLGRITGLDAAGPLYRFFPKSLRLSNTDAIFVDGIHTGGAVVVLTGLGILRAYADQDYFPNGGSKQPGCKLFSKYLDSENKEKTAYTIIGVSECNHVRSLNYYRESINKCEFTAVMCDNYLKVRTGKCSNETSVTSRMGFHAKPIRSQPKKTNFYLQTGKEPPYCSD